MKENKNSRIKDSRLNETNIMNCGMKATIIEYRSSKDIDVQFEDGTIVKNCQYSSFRNGNIYNKNCKSAKNLANNLILGSKNSRIGLKKKMNCGKVAKIVEYRNANDIDVMFEGSDNVLQHRKYQHFKNGNISFC